MTDIGWPGTPLNWACYYNREQIAMFLIGSDLPSQKHQHFSWLVLLHDGIGKLHLRFYYLLYSNQRTSLFKFLFIHILSACPTPPTNPIQSSGWFHKHHTQKRTHAINFYNTQSQEFMEKTSSVLTGTHVNGFICWFYNMV